jgi:hypothetical protein
MMSDSPKISGSPSLTPALALDRGSQEPGVLQGASARRRSPSNVLPSAARTSSAGGGAAPRTRLLGLDVPNDVWSEDALLSAEIHAKTAVPHDLEIVTYQSIEGHLFKVAGKRISGDNSKLEVVDPFSRRSIATLKQVPAESGDVWMAQHIVGLRGGGADFFGSNAVCKFRTKKGSIYNVDECAMTRHKTVDVLDFSGPKNIFYMREADARAAFAKFNKEGWTRSRVDSNHALVLTKGDEELRIPMQRTPEVDLFPVDMLLDSSGYLQANHRFHVGNKIEEIFPD